MLKLLLVIELRKVCQKCPAQEACPVKEIYKDIFQLEVDLVISNLDGKVIDILVAKESIYSYIGTLERKKCVNTGYMFKHIESFREDH